jgi:hypothetical protein
VSLAEGSFQENRLWFGFKSIPAELQYLQNYVKHIANPLIQTAQLTLVERSEREREAGQALQKKFKDKYVTGK